MSEEKHMLAPTPPAEARLTYDDFLLFPDDGMRHEIIDGVHFVTAGPSLRHQVLVGRLHLSIATHLEGRTGAGRVFLSPLDVVLSPQDVVEPDLLFVAGDQDAILTKANIQGPPALVVEVLSESTRSRDLGIEHELFARMNVREGHVLRTDLPPAFELSLPALFTDI